MGHNTLNYDIDRLCQDIWHYNEDRIHNLTLTEKDFILLQYIYTLYQDIRYHYYIGFKFLNRNNREYKKYYEKEIIPLLKDFYLKKERILFK